MTIVQNDRSDKSRRNDRIDEDRIDEDRVDGGRKEQDSVDEALDDGDLGSDDEFEDTSEDEEVPETLSGFDDDSSGVDEDGEEDIDAVVAMSSKEQGERSLEIRRAIEERMEERQLHEDLDYLDMDFDD